MVWRRSQLHPLRRNPRRDSGKFSRESEVSLAVRDTLAYGLVFGKLATFPQVFRWLLSDKIFPADHVSLAYSFWQPVAGRVPRPGTQSTLSKPEWLGRDLQRLQGFLARIPWVRAVWITGSRAAGTPHPDDDLDLMVLTDPQRLWLTRGLVVLWSMSHGKYRPRLAKTREKTRARWCWNLWLEPEALLELGKPEFHSTYLARELVQARLLYRREDVPLGVLACAAPWVQRVTYHGWREMLSPQAGVGLGGKTFTFNFENRVIDVINSFAFGLQHAYLRPHQTRERVAKNQAWFHPGTWSQRVQSEYEKMQQYMTDTQQLLDTAVWPPEWTRSEQAAIARLATVAQQAHRERKSVVLVSGVFDLFHAEHQNFLRHAAAAGDILLVVVESDLRTRELKGLDRPRQNQTTRVEQIRSFTGVAAAEILPESFKLPVHHETLVAQIRPDILAVSSHSPHQEKKAALLEKYGGKLQVVLEQNPALSTTQLLSVQ